MPHFLTTLARPGLILLAAILIASCSVQESRQSVAAAPVDLEVGEGFTNPVGYYEAMPRFSWKLAPSGESDLSLIHISEPTRPPLLSRMPSSA